jgi:undecaprenyl phosphate-alpha-L-ara4N flippase subunit ArnE
MRRPQVWIGVLLWATGAFAWIGVLQILPLGVAFPLETSTYAVIPLAAMLLLRERLRKPQLAGAALVVLGVACVAWSGA